MNQLAPSWEAQTIRRFVWLVAAIAALFVTTELVAFSGIVPHLEPVSLRGLITNPLFAIGFGSPVVLHLSSLPRWRELGVTLMLAVVFSALISVLSGDANAMAAVIGTGLASTAVLSWRSTRRDTHQRTAGLLFLLPSIVTLFFTLEAAMFLGFVSTFSPLTFDALTYVADYGFGFPISFATGQLFRDVPAIGTICTLIYLAPPPGLVFVYSLQAKSARKPRVDIVTLLLVMGAIGYSLYFVFPVCGPKFAFPAFPFVSPDANALAGTLIEVKRAPRNAVPSLHMASALIAWAQARPYGRTASIVGGIFAIGTFLATMGTGEHYFVDLVVAAPFTLAVYAALIPRDAITLRSRLSVIGAAVTSFVVWLFMMRFANPAFLELRAVPWFLLVTTIAVVLWGCAVIKRSST